MSKEIKDKAKEYLKAGLSVIPTKEDKLPALPTWKPYQSQSIKEVEVERLFSGVNVKGLAIICGAISGGLEVIDVDTKHDTTGSLWEELRGLIEDNLPELYSRLVIAQTKSGGYHIYYRCSSIDGNLKLSTKLNREVLIETRGEGGYVIAPPTPKYIYIQGEPGNIPTITTKDRDILFSIAKSFNELEEIKPKVSTTSSTIYKSTGLSPFEDYNQRGDLVTLLESKGWRVVNQQGQRINLLRPGSTDSKTSGNYHTGLRVLRVFSSSTEFNPDKSYSPSQVFSLLECSEDNKLTYRRLLELGYGEAYKGEDIRPTQVKTERIKVEVVNKVNRKTSIISTPGDSLKIENIQTAIGEEVIITSPGSEAREEILKAIDLIQETGKRIYIKEGATELREYRYQLKAIFNKYGTIQEESGGLTDRDRDSLLDEVLIVSTKLQPIDKDVFLKEFIELEAIKELGISEESLSITVDRLTSTRDKEAQAKEFKKLLSEATSLQEKGYTNKALELLDSKVKEVKLKDKATEFSLLLQPPREEEITERLVSKPESLDSGLFFDGEPLLLPSGAISIFAAPTSHGKTTVLLNLALNVAKNNKEAYFFSYEEDSDSILINALNIHLNQSLSRNNRKSIESYFKTGSTEYIKDELKETFLEGKESFFKDLVGQRKVNIFYNNYRLEKLIDAILYIHKNAKPEAIFIDYVQLIYLTESKNYSRQEELKEICIALKDVAVETGLPIVLGAQFNRKVVNPFRIHPTEIGEAGDIERIASLIVGFWKGGMPTQGTEEEKEKTNKLTPEGTVYMEILKNRKGRVGQRKNFTFNGNIGKVESVDNQSKSLI
jgi:Mrp family chromosome partitioning ATPase